MKPDITRTKETIERIIASIKEQMPIIKGLKPLIAEDGDVLLSQEKLDGWYAQLEEELDFFLNYWVD